MIESIMNSLLSIRDLWGRSTDPEINECRGYQKRIVVWSVMSVFLMLLAMFISPTSEPVAIIYPLQYGMAILLFVTSVIFIIMTLWNILSLYLFAKRHGFYE